MESVFFLVVLGVLLFGLLFAYKKRHWIARWLEDPDMALSSDPLTKRRRIERRIQDAQRELEIMDEIADNNKKE